MTSAAGRWAAATASVRGASHERDGKPNQDAVRVVHVGGPTPGLVAAVCDGHGGARYVRSDVGSRIGVEVACDVGRRVLQELGPSPSAATVEAALAGGVATAIVERWRQRVADDVQHRAFTDDERARAGATLEADPYISYGATLLLAVLGPAWVGLLQIGDGDVTVVSGAHAASPVPDDERLVGGETTSLCLPTAVADARVRALVEPLPETLILTTDGYANSFASPTWRTDAGLDLRDHVRRLGLDDVETRLPSWLADSAAAGGDDVSMALIQRIDGAPAPVPQATAPPATQPRPAAAARPAAASSRSRRRGGAVVGVAFVALVGIGVGWVVAGGNDPSADSANTAAGTTTTAPTVDSTLAVTPTTLSTGTTTGPTATTQAAVLAAGDEPVLLIGEGVGLLLAFDPTQAVPVDPHFFGWVTIPKPSDLLPPPWSLDNGNLTRDGTCVQGAVVAVHAGDYIWVVGPNRVTLVSYDVATGDRRERGTIEGSSIPGAPSGSADCADRGATQGTTSSTGIRTTTSTQPSSTGSAVQANNGRGNSEG